MIQAAGIYPPPTSSYVFDGDEHRVWGSVELETPITPPKEHGDYALHLAAKNYPVLPCCWPDADGNCNPSCPGKWDKKSQKMVCHEGREIGKAPLISGGYHNATTKRWQIRRWWKKWPIANIGVALAPSNLVMIDPDSEEALAEVEELGLPTTLSRQSHHTAFLYRVPEGTPTVRLTGNGHFFGSGFFFTRASYTAARLLAKITAGGSTSTDRPYTFAFLVESLWCNARSARKLPPGCCLLVGRRGINWAADFHSLRLFP